MIGITAYGTYIPDGAKADDDEDSLTMAIAAAANLNLAADKVGAVYVGSESHPYAVKSTAAMLADWMDWGPNVLAADLEFACKSGTSAMQVVYGLVKAGLVQTGVAVGTDSAQAGKNDPLAQTVGAGAAVVAIGMDGVLAEIIKTASYCTDTPDFWRNHGELVPRHAGRFTGEPGYFHHLEMAWKLLDCSSDEVDYLVVHQPNQKFPQKIAKRLGFAWSKLEPGFVFPESKNAYSATCMLGLAKVLDHAKPNQTIAVLSYGSGAGADAFLLKTTDALIQQR